MQAELEGRYSGNELQTEDTASHTLTSEAQKQAERGHLFLIFSLQKALLDTVIWFSPVILAHLCTCIAQQLGKNISFLRNGEAQGAISSQKLWQRYSF